LHRHVFQWIFCSRQWSLQVPANHAIHLNQSSDIVTTPQTLQFTSPTALQTHPLIDSDTVNTHYVVCSKTSETPCLPSHHAYKCYRVSRLSHDWPTRFMIGQRDHSTSCSIFSVSSGAKDSPNLARDPSAPAFTNPAWTANPKKATIARRPCLISASFRLAAR